jgi:RHS repeat-associated protein
LTPAGACSLRGHGQCQNGEKKQQVLALGRLGWPLRQIQKATRIRRETASQYLKAAGIAVRPPGGWGRRAAKPANEVITDFGAAKPAIAGITDPNCNPKTNPENPSTKGKAKATSKPANEVITDPEVSTDLNPDAAATGMMRFGACSFSVAFRNRYKFTGKARDSESGPDFVGARYYGNALGRFTSPDPNGTGLRHLLNPQKLNKYSYVLYNPMSFFDPNGVEEVTIVYRTFIPTMTRYTSALL